MASKQKSTFNAQAFLDSPGIARKIVEYRRAEVIFTQGDPCESVLYIQKGNVKLSVLSKTGREAIVAMLAPSDFFGEGCLAGHPFAWGVRPRRRTAPSSSWTRIAARPIGSVHHTYAGAEHPDRGGPNRPAVQLQ